MKNGKNKFFLVSWAPDAPRCSKMPEDAYRKHISALWMLCRCAAIHRVPMCFLCTPSENLPPHHHQNASAFKLASASASGVSKRVSANVEFHIHMTLS